MTLTWNHLFMGVAALCAAGSELLGAYLQTGNNLPFHLTAAAGLTVVTVLGGVSKSIMADKGAKSSTIAVDVLRVVADSLEAGPPDVTHIAILDALKQNLAVTAAKAQEVPRAGA